MVIITALNAKFMTFPRCRISRLKLAFPGMKIFEFIPVNRTFACLAMTFILSSCASTPSTPVASQPSEFTSSQSPKWYSDYLSVFPECEQSLLCVVGEGDSPFQAEREARLEASKFFETKVKSSTQLTSASEQKVNQTIGEFSEWAQKTITEETNELLSGLEVKQQTQVSNRFYVLMSLDREKTAQRFRSKILEIDKENEQLIKTGSRFVYPKILRNLSLSLPMQERYSLLSSRPLGLVVSKALVTENINKLSALKMAMISKGAGLPSQLAHTINEMIAPLKIIIVPKSEAGIQNTLVSELVAEELYFKVEGFKRLNVILKLELLNNKGEVLGRLSASSEQTSRSKEKAMEAALPILKDALLENFNQLSHATE